MEVVIIVGLMHTSCCETSISQFAQRHHFTFYCKIYRASSAFNCAYLHQFI